MQKIIQLILSLVSVEQIPIKSGKQCDICMPKIKKLLYVEVVVVTIVVNLIFKYMG